MPFSQNRNVLLQQGRNPIRSFLEKNNSIVVCSIQYILFSFKKVLIHYHTSLIFLLYISNSRNNIICNISLFIVKAIYLSIKDILTKLMSKSKFRYRYRKLATCSYIEITHILSAKIILEFSILWQTTFYKHDRFWKLNV